MSNRGADTKYHPDLNDKAREILSQGKSKAAVCAAFGICRDTLYEWANIYPDFNRAIKQGLEAGQAWWEEKSTSGTMGEIDGFKDGMARFLMSNRFRQDYSDKERDKDAAKDSLIEKLVDKITSSE